MIVFVYTKRHNYIQIPKNTTITSLIMISTKKRLFWASFNQLVTVISKISMYQLVNQYRINLNLLTVVYLVSKKEILINHIIQEIDKMGWGTNQKAQAKRQKEEAQKRQKAQKKKEENQNKKWKDSQTDKKIEAQREKQEKREKELARKREMKQLAERQEAEMQKINKKKDNFAEKKLTQAQIANNIEEREKKAAKQLNSHQTVFHQQNPNRQLEGYQIAETVQQALQILENTEEKHPEKRYKAAFEAFCSKRQISLKVEYPKLKRSQRLQMMRKQFQKSEQNPFNKNIVAYNDKTRKQAKNAKKQLQKKQKQETEIQQKPEQAADN